MLFQSLHFSKDPKYDKEPVFVGHVARNQHPLVCSLEFMASLRKLKEMHKHLNQVKPEETSEAKTQDWLRRDVIARPQQT